MPTLNELLPSSTCDGTRFRSTGTFSYFFFCSSVLEPTAADSNLIETADDALELMRATGQPNVKVMFDTYHVMYRNEVPSDYVYTMAPHLAHIHFADTDRLAPGDGETNWRSVMQAVLDIKYAGHVTMEIGFNTRRADPDRYAYRALSYLKALERELE